MNLTFREWLLRVFLNSSLFGVSWTAEPGMEIIKLIAGSWALMEYLPPRDLQLKKVSSSLQTPLNSCKKHVTTAVFSSQENTAKAKAGSKYKELFQPFSCSSNYPLLRKLCCKSSGSLDTLSDSRPPTVTHKTLQRSSWINMWKLS